MSRQMFEQPCPPVRRTPATRLARVLAIACALAGTRCGTDAPKENFKPRRESSAANARAGETRDASAAAIARDAEVSDPAAAEGGVRADASSEPARDAAASSDASALDASSQAAAAGGGAAERIRMACGEPPVTSGAFSRERLREAAADCAIHRNCAFDTAARTLESAVSAWSNDRGEPQLTAARQAWREAMDQWSRAELFQFGPAASAAMSAGKDTYEGQGLRDRIYAWPASARCRVEEEILDQTTSFANVLVSGRGLFAIEYALFYAGTDSACAATAQAWAALSADDLSARKAAYALAVARDVLAQSEALVEAWSSSGGNFKQTFVSASGKYPSEQEALNVLGWALIYIEKEVKDWKLGIPAGYTMGAPVEGPEAPFARTGTANIRANLRGFRQLFQGCGDGGEGLGFDDWLSEAGHAQLATDLVTAWEAAQQEADSLPPLHEASSAELDSMYQTLRQLTTLLKGDLFGAGSPLNLKLPASVEGDTD